MKRALAFLGAAAALAACGTLVGSSDSTSSASAEAGAPGDAAKVLADSAPYDGPVVDTSESDAGASCPGDAGPKMIAVTVGGKTMCVDATEVTRAQYLPFVAADAGFLLQPQQCQWNTNFAPNCSTPTTAPDAPVDCIDWCDAFAYCAWAGKRLCGKIGGGSATVLGAFDPATDQWFAACSRGGAQDYVYGKNAKSGTCADSSENADMPSAVGSHKGCEGGFPGLFDMNGNVMEWEDLCTASIGSGDLCQVRGGDFTDDAFRQSCSQNYAPIRNTRMKELGFRCCADLP